MPHQEPFHNPKEPTVSYLFLRWAPLPTDTSNIAICTKPTYRCRVYLEILHIAMHVTHCFLETGARLNFVNMTLITQPWQHCIQRVFPPELLRGTKHPLHIEDKLMLHIRFGFFCVKARLSVVFDLVVDMHLVTLIMDRFIRGILSSKPIVVPRNSHKVTVPPTIETGNNARSRAHYWRKTYWTRQKVAGP